jgi:hypothetical protein
MITACAITALCSLAILRQGTTAPQVDAKKAAALNKEESEIDTTEKSRREKLNEAVSAPFYMAIFDEPLAHK